MLKGIDPRLNADLLYALRAMGHGDTLVIADVNFPATSTAVTTRMGKPLHMDNLTSSATAEAILSVMPLDDFVDDFAVRMQVVGDPDQIPDVQKEVQDAINRNEGRERQMIPIERFAFYDMARQAFCIVQCGERRFYGCVIFRKGVIGDG